MRELVTLTGMVLTAAPSKEYDKRVEILTKERGRITAFAQGARRPNNILSACTIPFTFGVYHLYEGKSSYNIQSAEGKEYFEAIAADFDALCYASYFAEMVQYFTRENMEASEELTLLYITLKAVTHKQIPLELIRIIYEMRLMQVEGEGLELFRCIKCKEEKSGSEIYLSQGGMICPECASKIRNRIPDKPIALGNDSLYTLQYIVTAPIQKLYSFRVSDSVSKELIYFMKSYLKRYLNHDFKSLTFL